MKFDIDHVPLTRDAIPALLLLRSDPNAIRTAQLAASHLRQLFKSFQSSDLLRRAALMPDGGHEWLTRLASEAEALTEALKRERHEADQILNADHVARHRHDIAAMSLVVAAEDQLRALKARRETIVREEHEMREALKRAHVHEDAIEGIIDRQKRARLRERLSIAGLTAAEIDQALTNADPVGEDNELAEIALQVGVEESRRSALLAFVKDPLRRLASLPEPLREEVQQRAAQMDAARAPRQMMDNPGPFAERRPAL